MSTMSYRKPYPPEFRREAVQLVRSSGKSMREVARDLDVSYESLRIWVKQATIDAGERKGLTSEERSELRELRRKVRTTKIGSASARRLGTRSPQSEDCARRRSVRWKGYPRGDRARCH
jgi:transposase